MEHDVHKHLPPNSEGLQAWKRRCARSLLAKFSIELLNSTAQISFSLQASRLCTAASFVLSLAQIAAQQGALALHMKTGTVVVSVVRLVMLACHLRRGWLGHGRQHSCSGLGASGRAGHHRCGLPSYPAAHRPYLWLTITYFRAWFPCVLVYGAYAAVILVYIRPKDSSPPAPPRPTHIP